MIFKRQYSMYVCMYVCRGYDSTVGKGYDSTVGKGYDSTAGTVGKTVLVAGFTFIFTLTSTIFIK